MKEKGDRGNKDVCNVNQRRAPWWAEQQQSKSTINAIQNHRLSHSQVMNSRSGYSMVYL